MKIVRESISLNEKFLDYAKDDYSLYELHINPFPDEVPANIRGLIDAKGNLLIATCKDDWATHNGLYRLFNSIGHKVDYPYNSRNLNQGKSIAVQRYYDTHILCFGESYTSTEEDAVDQSVIELFNTKQKEWEIVQVKINRYNRDIELEKIDE
jgi:hypothetical protein